MLPKVMSRGERLDDNKADTPSGKEGAWGSILLNVLEGRISLAVGSEIAANQGLDPLLDPLPDPHTIDSDPMTDSEWSLPMAVAWKATRDVAAVRWCWPSYRRLEQRLIPVPEPVPADPLDQLAELIANEPAPPQRRYLYAIAEGEAPTLLEVIESGFPSAFGSEPVREAWQQLLDDLRAGQANGRHLEAVGWDARREMRRHLPRDFWLNVKEVGRGQAFVYREKNANTFVSRITIRRDLILAAYPTLSTAEQTIAPQHYPQAKRQRKPRPLKAHAQAIEDWFINVHGGIVWPNITDRAAADAVMASTYGQGLEIFPDQVRKYRLKAEGRA